MFKNGFEKAVEGKGESQPQWRFQEISKAAPDQIVEQLAGHDRVHVKGARTIDELRRCRLGGEDYDRTCFGLVGTDGTVHSAIYVYKMYESVRSDEDYHGDVAGILSEESRPDQRDPKALIFYSISNITNVMGGGQRLVADLYDFLRHNYPDAKRSTLSPLRDFDEAFTETQSAHYDALPQREKIRHVLNHLLSATNPVQNFHLGNGARIADIKLEAGDLSLNTATGHVRRHVAMVNYAYDVGAEELRSNAQAYGQVKRLMRNSELDPQEKASQIRSMLVPLVSPLIWYNAGLDGHLPGITASSPPSGDSLRLQI